MLKILLVDDHTLVREGLAQLLNAEDDIEVVGETGSGRAAVQLCNALQPDVVLLDYVLPDSDGLETTSRIVAHKGRARILVLTMYANEEYAIRLLRAGASGFLVKGASTDELLRAVRAVAARCTYVTPSIQEKLVARIGQPEGELPESVLSNRELQVLTRLARGATTREVADELGISRSTAESHRAKVLEKLNLRNNADMTRFAIKRRLVELE